MGRQWNQIIESLGPLTGGTMSINANLGDIEALLTTLQADVADGIGISSASFSQESGASISAGDSVAIGFRDVDNDVFTTVSTGDPFPVNTIGTVTANVSSAKGTTTIGTLTASTTNGTLFGTNSTRNYLLVQCTSGTAYIDTNGTATTADGILLTSGQGITFEGNFIPTGAIAAITSTGTARLIGRQG
jgi:hypothetical protein